MSLTHTDPEPIRPGWSDLAAVARIQRDSFRSDLAYKRWMLVVFWIMPGVTFLITRDRDEVTGCIIADNFNNHIRIMNIAVHPRYRHQGLGRLLMNRVLNAQPDKPAMLMVQEHNTDAQKLYEQLGFQVTGSRKSYYGPGNTGIEMKRKRV